MEDVPVLEDLANSPFSCTLYNSLPFHSAMERQPSHSSQIYHDVSSNLEKSLEDQRTGKINAKY